jgi:hypothetical protein
MSRGTLVKANPENLIRLAKYLNRLANKKPRSASQTSSASRSASQTSSASRSASQTSSASRSASQTSSASRSASQTSSASNPPLLTKVELESQKQKLQEQIKECEQQRKILALILQG